MTEPSKQRPGDQVLPDGEGACVQDRIIAEMHQSKEVGIQRYGQTLRTFNGRRGIEDVREEARDLFVYLTQVATEAEATRDELVEVVTQALWRSEADDATSLASIAVDRITGWVAAHSVLVNHQSIVEDVAPIIAASVERRTADAIADRIEARLKDWPEYFPGHRVIRDCARFARSFSTDASELVREWLAGAWPGVRP
jgi:hypothetical protein